MSTARYPEIQFAQSVLFEEAESLRAAASKLSGSFVEALDLLDAAHSIVLLGVGKSGLIAQKIAATMRSVGLHAYALNPVDAMHGDLGMVGTGTVCVLLSKSGTSAELVSLLPVLQRRHIKTIGIIGRSDSYLGRLVDVFLDASVQREACPLDVVPSSSTTLALALGDALALSMMKRRNVTAEDFALHHPFGQLGRNLSLSVVDVMHSGDALALCGPNESFREALIRSSAKALGCVCVVNDDNTLAGIITDGDVRRILQRHEDIRELIASDVMTTKARSAHQTLSLQEALRMMEEGERQISVLPIVDSEMHCVGLLRLHDILQVQH